MRLINVITITIVCLGAQSLEAATLTWNANPEPNVTGYRIAYGTQPGVHSTTVDVGNVVTYSFNPPSGQRYYIAVMAYNGMGTGPESDEVVLDLTTTVVVNQPPTLNQPPNQSGIVGSSASVALTASDPEGASLAYSATGLPPGLALNGSSGAIAGTLATAGTYNVTVSVSDGSLSASRSFMWTVTAPTASTTPPAPPADTTGPSVAFTSPTNNETLTAKKIQFKASASDSGGVRSVRYLVDGNAVSGDLTTTPYAFSWTANVANGAHQISARAVDNAGNSSTATITVTISAGGNGRKSVDTTGIEIDADQAPESSTSRKPDTSAETALDVAVTGDFDGDGLIDPGTFTKATGEWRLWLSSGGYSAIAPLIWGAETDMPLPADYDGDGRTDLAVFRPSTGTWSIVASNKGTPSRLDVSWGRPGDDPVAFDYDHDGRADLALRRSGGFDILLSSSNYTTSVTVR